MKYEIFGDSKNPVIILLHGGGLSNWTWQPQLKVWEEKYYVVAPIIDGHGADYETTFDTIEHSANQIQQYINENFSGKVFAIIGVSLGAQITVEIITKAKDICEKAVLESALVIPMNKALVKLIVPMYSMFFPLISKKWFAKISAYYYYIPKDMFQNYFEDTKRVSKKTMLNMTISNSNYSLPTTFKDNKAKLLILCAKKEPSIVRKSAKLLHSVASESTLKEIKNSRHGISLNIPQEYIEIVSAFFETELDQ